MRRAAATRTQVLRDVPQRRSRTDQPGVVDQVAGIEQRLARMDELVIERELSGS